MNRCGVRTVINAHLQAQSLKSTLRKYCTNLGDSNDFFKEFPSAYVTGISIKTKDRGNIGRIATYWGRDDPLNTYKELNDENVNIVRAQIEAVSFALRQAIYEKKLDGVLMKTDSQFVEKVVNRYLQYWRSNNFHKADGTEVKNRKEIEELDQLLHSINTKVEYSSFEKNGTNVLLTYLKEEGVMTEDLNMLRRSETAPVLRELSNYLADSNITDDGHPPPTVYVTGSHSKSGNNKFLVAGYGIHWADGESVDRCERFAEPPITLYRAQLTGIISALEEAVRKRFQRVDVAIDSGIFLGHYRANWMKNNGEPIANYAMYRRILNLLEKIQVRFKYIPETLGDVKMGKAKQLAVDGMAYPVLRKTSAPQFPVDLKEIVH